MAEATNELGPNEWQCTDWWTDGDRFRIVAEGEAALRNAIDARQQALGRTTYEIRCYDRDDYAVICQSRGE